MATDVIMPALGMAQEKGSLVSWLKAEGESVTKGEPLMEVETDKATVEVEAPASGILANVTATPGDEIPVGQRIAVILAPGESLKQERPTAKFVPVTTATPAPASKPSVATEALQPATAGRIGASPAAKRIAKEKGVDLANLKGSGPQGSILAGDVLRTQEGKPQAVAETAKGTKTLPLSAMRRIVGERMVRSKQTAPHFYVSMAADMTEVQKKRTAWKEKRQEPIPSINDCILQAAAQALRAFPTLNSTFTDKGIELHADINIAMAVALEQGLVAPVIRNADGLTLEQLAQKSRELAEKAQKKKLFPLDYEGGTFTVSNLGMLGADSFVAIINPPQCAILAVGQVAPRVVVRGDEIVVRPVMTMTLSADHRIADGALAARFLHEVKRLLEQPIV